jgi:hypothetical protein
MQAQSFRKDGSHRRVTQEAPPPTEGNQKPGPEGPPMAAPIGTKDYTDGRAPWDWQTRFPREARRAINCEAWTLAAVLIVTLVLSALAIWLAQHEVNLPISLFSRSPESNSQMLLDFRLISVFLSGAVGGTTFSVKWLIHAVAKGSWHLDRRYWRLFVPLVGGVYACVVLTLFDVGMMGGQPPSTGRSIASTAALAFLVGYFSDGVSGLLSNVANAVFGTVKER